MKNLRFRLVLVYGLIVHFSATCTWAPVETQEPPSNAAPAKSAAAAGGRCAYWTKVLLTI